MKKASCFICWIRGRFNYSTIPVERIKTCLYEFGHVLGLDEFTNIETTSNVMHQGIRGVTTLGSADIAVYRAKWN